MSYLAAMMLAELGAMLTTVFVGLVAICLALLLTCGLAELRSTARTRRGIAQLENFVNRSVRGD